MRVTWRGLELPRCVERDAAISSDKYGRFFIEPFDLCPPETHQSTVGPVSGGFVT